MTQTIEINIDNYLSEEDKIELAKDLFKEELRRGFLEKTEHKKIIENYERVIYNSVYNFLDQEVDKIIGEDHKTLINSKVKEILKKDLTYHVFRHKDIWDNKPSKATKYLEDAVDEHKDILIQKVKDAFNNTEINNVEEYLVDCFRDVLLEKLSS